MKTINLFGELQETETKTPKSKYQIIKARNKYGLAKVSAQSCKHCINCLRKRGNSKTFYKCKLIGCSASTATDIRLKDTCNKFEFENK